MSGIKVITEPRVYVLGRQVTDDGEIARFLADEGVESWSTDAATAGEKLVEVGGRLCYMSFAKPRPGGNAGYIGHILGVGHGSVLEHAVWSLLITGVSRALTHELVRHRAGISPSQLSQRYVDESDVAFVVPPAIAEDGILLELWEQQCESALAIYRSLADGLVHRTLAHVADPTARRKAAREAARSVLPNATETKIVITANARALRHFIEMRGSAGADAEMRRLARGLLGLMKAEAPVIFDDFGILADGSVASVWNKV